MSARIIQVRDGVADKIRMWWAPDEPSEVLTPWDIDLDTSKLAGRKVLVFPSAYTGNPASRAEDLNDYTLVVLVSERYPDKGELPAPWVDERVSWCADLLGALGDARGPRLLADPDAPGSGLWPEVAECTTVYDVALLAGKKLFLSVLTLTYRESAEA